ncbi:MAG TPA: FkbM family methyltransferase [Gemmataceae bacterium]|nr:FkbM family methyltransferase [Gemmataceae bacterium]
MDQEELLGELLAADPVKADLRASAQLPWGAGSPEPLVLVGAGTLGRFILKGLRKSGVQPVAWADDTLSKQGTLIDGVPVLPVETAARQLGRSAVWVVTILNPAHRFLRTRQRLEQLGCLRICSYLHLIHVLADNFLPYYLFDKPSRILAQAPRIEAAFRLLADDESRRQFIDLLRFRLQLDYDTIPPSGDDSYFPPELVKLPSDVTFVDGGAFTGDTIERFLQVQGDRFRRIVALEPDETNFSGLCDYVRRMGESREGRTRAYRAAVGSSHRVERFASSGDMSASFSASGTSEVEVLPLDEILSDDEKLYIKLDIEGAEMDALRGARRTLSEARPALAVCVYHKPEDMWDIPLHLHEVGAGHQLYLRTEGTDGMDVVCYALPPGRGRTPQAA